MSITTKTMQEVFGMGGGEQINVYLGRDRVPRIDPHYVWNPLVLKVLTCWHKFGRLAEMANLVLFGPFGCGKSEAVRQFAARVGIPVFEDAGSPERTYADFVGLFLPTEQGGVAFQDSLLVQSMRTPGSIYLINEMDKLNPSTLADLHNLLDTGIIENPFTGEKIEAHEGWRFAGTTNTNGQGDTTGAYHGTNQLNRATCSRFMWVKVDYIDDDSELKILKSASEMDEQMLKSMQKFAAQTRRIYSERGSDNMMSTRQLVAWAVRTEKIGSSATINGPMGVLNITFMNACRPEDQETFKQTFFDIFGLPLY